MLILFPDQLGLSQKFCVFVASVVADVGVLTRWPCDQGLGAVISVPWLSGDFFFLLLYWVSQLLALCLFFQLSEWGVGFVLVVFYFNLNK